MNRDHPLLCALSMRACICALALTALAGGVGGQVVFMKTPDDTHWNEIGRTEVVANNLNPRFVKLIAAVRRHGDVTMMSRWKLSFGLHFSCGIRIVTSGNLCTQNHSFGLAYGVRILVIILIILVVTPCCRLASAFDNSSCKNAAWSPLSPNQRKYALHYIPCGVLRQTFRFEEVQMLRFDVYDVEGSFGTSNASRLRLDAQVGQSHFCLFLLFVELFISFFHVVKEIFWLYVAGDFPRQLL